MGRSLGLEEVIDDIPGGDVFVVRLVCGGAVPDARAQVRDYVIWSLNVDNTGIFCQMVLKFKGVSADRLIMRKFLDTCCQLDRASIGPVIC
jgi:hypothetical protein